MERRDWKSRRPMRLRRTAVINCSFVVATGPALWISLSNVEMSTSTYYGTVLIWRRGHWYAFALFRQIVFGSVWCSSETKGQIVDYTFVVFFLQISKPWLNKKSRSFSVANKIASEVLADKAVRKQFPFSLVSKFRQLPEVFEDIEIEWSSI